MFVQASNNGIASKNYIPILGNTDYYFNLPRYGYVVFYDADKNYISGITTSYYKFSAKTPANSAYMQFSLYYGSTVVYNHDICINISDPNRNGTYEPYKKDTLDLDWIREIEYTPEGSTTPEKLFPYGLLSAGTVHDEVTDTGAIKRVGAVDLGSLTWSNSNSIFISPSLNSLMKMPVSNNAPSANGVCSKYGKVGTYIEFIHTDKAIYTTWIGAPAGLSLRVNDSTYTDTATFKAAMQGVMLYYELETPIEIPLDETHRMSYVVADHGTEQQLPINVSSVINAPFRGTFEYYSNFKDAALDVIATWGDKTPSEEPLEAGKSYYNDTVPTSKATWTAVAKRNVAAAPVSTLPEVNNYPAIIIRNAAFTDAPQFVGQFYVQIGIGAWIGIGTSTTADWKPITA